MSVGMYWHPACCAPLWALILVNATAEGHGAKVIQRALDQAQGSGGDVGVDLGGLHAAMAQQFANVANVGTLFQVVGGKAVSQCFA